MAFAASYKWKRTSVMKGTSMGDYKELLLVISLTHRIEFSLQIPDFWLQKTTKNGPSVYWIKTFGITFPLLSRNFVIYVLVNAAVCVREDYGNNTKQSGKDCLRGTRAIYIPDSNYMGQNKLSHRHLIEKKIIGTPALIKSGQVRLHGGLPSLFIISIFHDISRSKHALILK